ncbi:hypothetical protein D9M69_557820 [compost metagenome]
MSDRVIRTVVIFVGICIRVMMYPKLEAKAIRIITIETVRTVRCISLGRSRQR